MIQLFTIFSDFNSHRKKTNKAGQFLAVDLSPTILSSGATDETLQQSGKQGLLQTLIEEFS